MRCRRRSSRNLPPSTLALDNYWPDTNLHPAPVVLKRLLNERIYPGPREVFTTLLRPETKAVLGRRGNAFASDHGHVVVRVAPGGETYRIFILDAVDGPLAVREVRGPYEAR